MDETEQLRNAAWNLLQLGRLDDAEEYAGKALTRDPENASLHRLMGELQLALERLDRAAEHAHRAITLDASVESLHLGARTYRAAGDHETALELIGQAIALEPDRAVLHISRSLTLSARHIDAEHSLGETSTVDVAQSRIAARRALELEPDNSRALYAAALSALAAGDLPAAAQELTRSLDLEPDHAASHTLMGVIRARQGMVKLSSRHFVEAGRLAPGDNEPVSRLRRMASTKGGFFSKRQLSRDPVHLAPEARRVLEVDRQLPRYGGG